MTSSSKSRSRKQEVAHASKSVKKSNEIRIVAANEEEAEKKLTRGALSPHFSSAMVSKVHWEVMTKRDLSYDNLLAVLKEDTDKISKGDLSDVEAMLYSQASSLNLMFAHLNTLAVNNIISTGTFEFGRQLMAMAQKAQNQSRMTLETLGNIKNGPLIYAKQANINNGGQQQVNNGSASRAPATDNGNPPNKLLEQSDEQRLDSGTKGQTGSLNSKMAAVGKRDRPTN